MKGILSTGLNRSSLSAILVLQLVLTCSPVAFAQQSGQGATTQVESPQARMTRARALAAIGRLAQAASELEALRSSSDDEAVRDVGRILLVWIYVEMPDYRKASDLLVETFNARARARNRDEATRAYYALAGQAINGVRAHLERYRTFGLNVADGGLPAEANTDLEQLRGLLSQITESAKVLREEEKAAPKNVKGSEAAALLEDAASVRLRLARDDSDRAHWQSEVSDARQQLFASETRIASLGQSIPVQTANANPPAQTPAGRTAGPANDARTPNQGQASRGERTATPASQDRAATPPAQSTEAAGPPRPDNASGGGGAVPVAVGSLASKARQRVSPSYPAIAKAARVMGVVTVHLLLDERGNVVEVQRTEGPAQLQQAAAEAARRWKFNQTLIDGRPVPVTGYLSFNFEL